MSDRALTVRDLCDRYGVTEHTVLGWIRSGELRAINVGRSLGTKKPRWRITPEALQAFDALARSEGILPALETAHAIAKAMEVAAQRPADQIVLVCLSGRGDKDAAEIARLRGETIFNA